MLPASAIGCSGEQWAVCLYLVRRHDRARNPATHSHPAGLSRGSPRLGGHARPGRRLHSHSHSDSGPKRRPCISRRRCTRQLWQRRRSLPWLGGAAGRVDNRVRRRQIRGRGLSLLPRRSSAPSATEPNTTNIASACQSIAGAAGRSRSCVAQPEDSPVLCSLSASVHAAFGISCWPRTDAEFHVCRHRGRERRQLRLPGRSHRTGASHCQQYRQVRGVRRGRGLLRARVVRGAFQYTRSETVNRGDA